jgi:nucleoside-diphosphate-sugar epimerase
MLLLKTSKSLQEKDPSVLITGATGFLGRHLIPRLVFSHSVRCLVRKSSDISSLERKNVQIFYGDLTDQESLVQATQGVDVVIHMAAACRQELRENMSEVNVEGTRRLVNACKAQKVSKLIYLSSVAVLFEGDLQNDEYCYTKRIAEEIVMESGMPVIVLRPSAIYPEKGGFTVPVKIARYFPILPLPVSILEKKLQQPVAVENVIEVILVALNTDKLKVNKPYFVVGPNTQTISELLDKTTVYPFKPLKIKVPDFILKGLASLGVPIDLGHLKKRQRIYNFDIAESVKDFDYNPLDISVAIHGGKGRDLY